MKFWKKKQRDKLRAQAFPAKWVTLLERHVALYNRLPVRDREELHGHIHVFLAEKTFEGCAGLEMTDTIRLTIAAQACVLLLHRDTDYYPSLSSILVYPSSYVAPVVEHEGGIVSEFEEERAGETWSEGSLVLSWDDVSGEVAPRPASEHEQPPQHRAGNGNGHDRYEVPQGLEDLPPEGAELVPAYNVVIHEFAHQLDIENGALDGVPKLATGDDYATWESVFTAAFDRLLDELERDLEPVIDPYGAEDEAEFFACVTESFFDTPIALLEEYPDVYTVLASYFDQNPVNWGAT